MIRWVELSMWLSIQNTLEIASVDGLGPANGNLTPVLQQAGIPVTLMLSSVLLARKYSWRHWLAALIVMGGIAASYVPLLLDDSSGGRADPPKWGWALLFVLSRIPQSVANVRCEAILLSAPPAAPTDGRAVNEAVLNQAPASREARWQSLRALLACGFWTALLGLGFNFASSLLLACARGLGNKSTESVMRDYSAGAACLFRANASITADDPCRAAPGATAAFALPGVLFAISEFQVLQLASAASYFLLIALELPLQAAALAAPFVMGSLASAYHPSLFYGVPLIILGLLVWAGAERRLARGATMSHSAGGGQVHALERMEGVATQREALLD
jgi:hypothetical protein